ncbi:hypothetical protein ID866_3595 [Astraeus odoratus]|nr:hypothetical protein ID866_3595 [Astraeus odoratus]
MTTVATASPNGLVCFTNCLLPQEDGSLVEKDLWIDEHRGVILDAQQTFYLKRQRPAKVIDLGGNILSPGFIDIQINGAFGFDFSVYEGDDQQYRDGLKLVAERITETGVTALVPTIITQESSLYPKLLKLLRPWSPPSAAHLLGWHVEGPFLQMDKRGAHSPSLIIPASGGYETFEAVYHPENLADEEDWFMEDDTNKEIVGARIITAAPEIEGVMEAIREVTKKGVCFNIGHSTCSTATATAAIQNGARCITHLFNAMPQLHHRDPSIIGLLGSSPYVASGPSDLPFVIEPVGKGKSPTGSVSTTPKKSSSPGPYASEAFDDSITPPSPRSPVLASTPSETPKSHSHTPSTAATTPLSTSPHGEGQSRRGQRMPRTPFERPFYELIVDGIHSHPNSVRLAYSAHPEGCILITDAMKILDPHLRDGIHEWRDGRRFHKDGDNLYLENTKTLAGSVVTMDKCVRNFARFTGCSLGAAIKCATVNPAK